MGSRPKTEKRAAPERKRKPSVSINFFQGRNTSAEPEWGTEITRFKIVRRVKN